MEVELFQNSPTGTLVPISGRDGHRAWEHVAFLPHPLGVDSPDLSAAAHRAVAEARAALGRLDATAERLPNPRLFRHVFLRIEAQATSALEGTYEPLLKVLGSEPKEATSTAMTEVLNYLTVADEAFTWSEEGRPWSVSTLSELHRQLMLGTPAERDYYGVRPIQVVIGRREGASPTEIPIRAARYVPPPPGDDLRARLADLLQWAGTDHPAIDPVVAAAMTHYTFEALHPFHDGNGRLGRLFVVLQLHHLGVLNEPSITVSPWFEARRQLYYDALLGVSTQGDWSTWVELFAEGLIASALTARERMLALAQVQSELKAVVQDSPLRTANARLLVDLAVARPTFTVRQAAEHLGLQRPGAKKLIDSLVDLGVLAQFGDRNYDRRFHSPRVLAAILG
jgi:Fic family protein